MNTITLKEQERNDLTTYTVGQRKYSDNFYLEMTTAYVTGHKLVDLGEHGSYYLDVIKESTVTILEAPDKGWVKDQANIISNGKQVFYDWQRDYEF
jgi:hypothetical protein